jgi:uncharacterized membrane protein
MVPKPRRRHAETARDAGQSAYDAAVDVVLTGFAIIVPLVVTIYVLSAALSFIGGALSPVIRLMSFFGLIEGFEQLGFVQLLARVGIYESAAAFLTEIIAVIILAALVVAVGAVARHRHGEAVIDYFDFFISSIPGIGAIYKSFRRMGDMMLDSEVENFQEVKLVEFPREDTFVIGFETNESPPEVTNPTEHDEMTTLFLPLAPNPVMGGFLTHIPSDRVHDVDMTVEEGVRSIITSGVAAPGEEDGVEGVTLDRLRDISAFDRLSRERDAEDPAGRRDPE